MRFVVNALVGFLSLASPLSGQASPPAVDSNTVVIPWWHVGVAADIGQPVGDFKQNVNNAGWRRGLVRDLPFAISAVSVHPVVPAQPCNICPAYTVYLI